MIQESGETHSVGLKKNAAPGASAPGKSIFRKFAKLAIVQTSQVEKKRRRNKLSPFLILKSVIEGKSKPRAASPLANSKERQTKASAKELLVGRSTGFSLHHFAANDVLPNFIQGGLPTIQSNFFFVNASNRLSEQSKVSASTILSCKSGSRNFFLPKRLLGSR